MSEPKEFDETQFDEEELDDGEFDSEDFAEVDALIEYLQSLPRPEVSILNPLRVQQLRFSGAMIKRVLRRSGCKAKIVCKQHEFEPSVGVVRVEGVPLEITDMDGFAKAAYFANNTEILPLENGKVKMSFTFHGLLTPMH